MKKFTVRYTLNGFVYQSEIWTDSSGAALNWVANLFPDAKSVTVVE